MRTITRTAVGARLQAMQYFGLPYTHVDNTTLNEKFDIVASLRPDNGQVPVNRIFCIGNRGHRVATGADGYPYTDELQHEPTDGSVYGPLPFVLRRVSDDLDPGTRAKYCLRRLETHGGQNYFAYYGKRLDLTGASPEMFYNTVNNNVTTRVPYVPTSANLNPTPPNIPPTGSVTTSGDYISVSVLCDLALSQIDIEALIEVSTILYGDERHAVVSELALVAGVDKTVTGPGPGSSTLNYLEAIEAQVTTLIADYHDLRYSNTGIDMKLNVGAVEPLLVTSAG